MANASMEEGKIKWEVQNVNSIKVASAEAAERRKLAAIPDLPKLSSIRDFNEKLEMEQRSFAAKALRNPLVPMGMFATVSALVVGLYALRKRDSRLQQVMMRWRVAAQSFTIVSLIGGFMFYARSQTLNRDQLMEAARQRRFQEEKELLEKEKERITQRIQHSA